MFSSKCTTSKILSAYPNHCTAPFYVFLIPTPSQTTLKLPESLVSPPQEGGGMRVVFARKLCCSAFLQVISSKVDEPFFHHQQGRVDFNTVNPPKLGDKGKFIPSALKISLGRIRISLGRRGWISQNLPRFGGAHGHSNATQGYFD